MVDWHPRHLVAPVEWLLKVPGHPEPVAVIRRVRLEGRHLFRAVTWAPTSAGRELIGYYRDGDAAAVAVWRRYIEQQAVRHDDASRTHGGRARHGAPAPGPDGGRE